MFTACHRSTGPRVFVTNEDDGTVTVIDARSFGVIDTIHVGQRPRGVRVSSDHKWLYVALSGSARTGPGVAQGQLPPDRAADGIGVVELGDLTLARTLPSGPDPESFTGARADALVTMIPDVGKRPWGVAIAPSGLVFTANGPSNDVSVIDPETSRVVHRIHAGGSPWGVAIAP